MARLDEEGPADTPLGGGLLRGRVHIAVRVQQVEFEEDERGRFLGTRGQGRFACGLTAAAHQGRRLRGAYTSIAVST